MDKLLQKYNKDYFNNELNLSQIVICITSKYAAALERKSKNSYVLYIHYKISKLSNKSEIKKAIICHELAHLAQYQLMKMSHKEIIEDDITGHGSSFQNYVYKFKKYFNIDIFSNDYYNAVRKVFIV